MAVCVGGAVVGVYHKRRLPNYGVFDEERWFAPGTTDLRLYQVAGVPVGVSICEDLWFPGGSIPLQAAGGARLVVNVNASPYSIGREDDRLAEARRRVAEAGCAIAYVNQVGGQDELVFDGGSFVMDESGTVLAAAPRFVESTLLVDVALPGDDPGPSLPVVPVSAASRAPGRLPALPVPTPLSEDAEVYEALVVGTRDYLKKNGFTDAVIGLSGGVDSSLVAAIAVDGLGAGHVHGLSMPSRYSSAGSVTDAAALAERLGIELVHVPIEPAHGTLASVLTGALGDVADGAHRREPAVADPRRGPHGGVQRPRLDRAHDRKQERAGDGLFDVVRRLGRWLRGDQGCSEDARVPAVPISKRPCRSRSHPRVGAEQGTVGRVAARPARRPELAARTRFSIRCSTRSCSTIGRSRMLSPVGTTRPSSSRVASLVDGAEYKRRQSPPGVRITAEAFGKDRRMPITNRYPGPRARGPAWLTGSTRSHRPWAGDPSTARAGPGRTRAVAGGSRAAASGPTDGWSAGSSRYSGSWVASEPVPEAQLLFDVYSQQHAWHAELFADRLPALDSVDAESLVVAPSAEVDRMFAVLAGVVPDDDPDSSDADARRGEGDEVHAGGTLPRLVGIGRVVAGPTGHGVRPAPAPGLGRRRRARHPVPAARAARRDRGMAGSRGADPSIVAPSPRRRRRHRAINSVSKR